MSKNGELPYEQFIWVQGKGEEVFTLVTLAPTLISMEIRAVFLGRVSYAKRDLSNV